MKWFNPRINNKSVFISCQPTTLISVILKFNLIFFMKSILKLTENEVKEVKE